MSNSAAKMKILESLKLPGFVKHDEKTAVTTRDGIELKMNVSLKPELWGAKIKGKSSVWTAEEVPEDFKEFVSGIIKDYNLGLLELADEIEEPAEESLNNLSESGFDLSNVPDVVKDKPVEAPKKDNWSKPAPKIVSKIDYNDGLETLPALTEIGIVRPVVTAQQALAAWNEFQALKKAIIEPSDLQEIEVFDKRTGTKKKSKFIKKSGWRKLAACFNLTIRTESEIKEPTKNGGFLWTMKVVCRAPNGREMEGVAKCSSDEKNGARIEHDVYTTAYTRAVNRAISDLIAAGEASAEEMVE